MKHSLQQILKKTGLTCTVSALLFLSLSAGAAMKPLALNSSTIAMKRKVPSQPQKAWSVPFTFETFSSLHAEGTYERQAGNSYSLSPSVKLTPDVRFLTSFTVFQETTGAKNTSFDNTPISLSLNTALTPSIAWVNTVAAILPTNQTLQEETSYQGSGKLGTALRFDRLVWNSSLRLSLSFTRNLHEFTQTNIGGFNMRESVGQGLDYSLPLTRTVSLNTAFIYTYGWTYQDDSRSKFYAGLDLSWNFLKDWTVSMGTSNEGSALKPNGADSNIEFYNDESSIVKLGLTYVL